MPVAASEPLSLAFRPRGASRLAERTTVGLRDFGRRRRTLITVSGRWLLGAGQTSR
jgi:hypothetical protein